MYCLKHLAIAISLFLALSLNAKADNNFTLSSPTVKPDTQLLNEHVFNGFGCTGKNVSPKLVWTGSPEGTKSFAITAYDPDAPTGSGWWHWVVYNIPATVSELAEGAGAVASSLMPAKAVQGRNDYGFNGFGGACPPEGSEPHHYIFTVYALKAEKFDLPTDASPALIGFMINSNTLSKASITAKYNR